MDTGDSSWLLVAAQVEDVRSCKTANCSGHSNGWTCDSELTLTLYCSSCSSGEASEYEPYAIALGRRRRLPGAVALARLALWWKRALWTQEEEEQQQLVITGWGHLFALTCGLHSLARWIHCSRAGLVVCSGHLLLLFCVATTRGTAISHDESNHCAHHHHHHLAHNRAHARRLRLIGPIIATSEGASI